MRRMTNPRRGGFTLVELLTVVAILAILSALAVTAFIRVRGSAEVGATEATLSKLKTGLDRRWKATLDEAKDDIAKNKIDPTTYANLLTFAGGDKDRAQVIYTYCKLKNEFPTTINEACNPIFGGVLQPKSVFLEGLRKQIQPINPTPVPTRVLSITSASPSAVESAACFYWSLTATAVRGETFGEDGTSQQAGDLTTDIAVTYTYLDATNTVQTGTGKIITLRVFKDAWGYPLAFIRMGYDAEVNMAPYSKPNLVAGNTVLAADMLDPLGKLPTVQDATANPLWNSTKLRTFWQAVAGNHLNYQWKPPQSGAVATFPAGATEPTGLSNTYPFLAGSPLKPWNSVPTVVSGGADKTFAPGFGGGDDLFSFRLARDSKGN